MKTTTRGRVLAWLLTIAMVLTMVPTVALASDSATWTKVEAADIQATDTIAITMTNPNGVTYALYTVQSGNAGPEAKVVTVSGNTMTTENTADYGWTVTAVAGGYNLTVNGEYLYSIDSNNGIRIGKTAAVWAVDGNYLSTQDSAGNTRWLGVYDNNAGDYAAVATPNWRAYKNTTGNTKNQTLAFWKLDNGAVVAPTDPQPTEPTPTDPQPTEPVVGLPVAEKLTALPANGDVVIIYNSGNAMGSAPSGTRMSAIPAEVTDNKLTVTEEMAQLTVTVDGDNYIFTLDGQYLTSAPTGNGMSFAADLSDCGKWTATEAVEGAWYLNNVGANYNGKYDQAMEYYNGFTTYGLKETEVYQMQLFVVTDEVVAPTEPAPTEPEPTEPEPTEPVVPGVVTAEKMTSLPADGDVIIIYNSGNAMGSAANGTKLAGVPAEVTDNKLTVTEEMAQLTVTVDGDNYIFSLDGQYLTSAPTGNGMSFAADLSDCGKWTATEAVEGAWYLNNVGANYNGNYNQAMEYYNGFTTYGLKETEVYQMQMFLVSEAAPVRENGIVTDLSTLLDGDTVVVFNPAHMKALSTSYSGFYNMGTDVTLRDGALYGYTAAELWTLGINEDGSYTFSTADGKKLSMGTGYTSTPLDDVNTTWKITAAATADCIYIENVGRPGYRMEFQDSYGTWSAYNKIGDLEALFAQQIYLVVDPEEDSGSDDLPAEGEMVMLYNLSAQGVLALMEGDPTDPSSCVINNALAAVEEGKANSANGGLVFKVEKNGDYYRFYNETFGYLCSTGTGNNAFYSLEASDDADWTVSTGKSGGYFLESRTAKFNGKYSQFLEYYAEAYKTYSMNNVTDYNIYEFFFYPCANEQLTGGVVNQPAFVYGEVEDAFIGKEYTLKFTVDAVFGVETIEANYDVVEENGIYTLTVPVEKVVGESLTILLNGKDTVGVEFADEIVVPVLDEPLIDEVTPAPNAQTGDDKRPVISAKLINEGKDITVLWYVNDEQLYDFTYENGVLTYVPAADMADGRVTVTLTVIRADGKSATKTWSFTIGKATFQLYFGQLHSHTTYSDGSGSLATALEYIAGLNESANVDFVAFTDHSNYFDGSNVGGSANPEGALYDMSLANASSQALWAEYVGAMREFNATHSDVLAVPGFEMTWSGGPGHINTFVTPGIVSRNNTTLNNKTADAGMKAYYALLSQVEGVDSISQFNHPGSTFGTFTDFSYWDALLDSRMFLVEVGNGEGQVGAGGYYPSYEYYTMALDKGWHVSPTNNQDNHKGKWGNANDARDVILADALTEEAIYEAIRAYRVYATEDKNLEIQYTVNDMVMGSIISEVPEALNLNVQVYDPDKSDSISKVEVIVNSGKVAYTWDDPAVLAQGELTCTLDPSYSYYYIRVTEGDGELAVTSPVWVGETLKLGISAVECGTSTPVTNEELTITTTLFNSEATDATVKSITYTTNGSVVLAADTTGYTVPASGALAIDWNYVPEVAKVMKITVTVVMEMDGIEYEFSMDVELDVLDADSLVYIGIDASHYNEYVAGNYADSMGNFSELAAGYSVRTVELKTSEDLIAACENENGKFKAVILTAPSRRLAAAQEDPRVYSDAELAALKEFNANGGMVILAGWSDNYENYAAITGNPDIRHMAETQNSILEALGSSLRITDDATHDDTYNGGQTQRLYFNSYNFDSFLVEGVEVDPENPHDRMYTEVYSQYGGATIHVVDASGEATSTVPATVTPIVFGHAGTYSKDTDNDGIGGESVPKYTYAEGDERLLVLASEELEGQGMIIVSGAAFMSNFEVQATIEDSGAEKNYSNYRICENLVQYLNPVKITDIAEVAAQTEVGYKYTIEGVVTSNASGYDKDTAFFDCIYVQDATGGICCFPVAGNFKIGDVVRVTGTTEFYQGEAELQVTEIEIIGEAEPVAPTAITANQLNNREVEGLLVTVSGVVKSFELANGLVQTIMVEDEEGNVARVFIDGYITTAEDVQGLEVGCLVSATGLASYDDTFNAPEGPFPRIRVRDRADIVCSENPNPPKVELPFDDVTEGRWFYEFVEYVYTRGLMTGMSETKFGPNNLLTREQIVTILYRMAGSPAVEGENPFADVPAGKYYTDAVIWASQNGITAGTSATTFSPKANIKRQELVAFLYRYAKYMGADVSVDPSVNLNEFTDVDDVSSFAVEPMTWAYANGLISGMGNNDIQPKGTATRAQVAKLITVLDQLLNG